MDYLSQQLLESQNVHHENNTGTDSSRTATYYLIIKGSHFAAQIDRHCHYPHFSEGPGPLTNDEWEIDGIIKKRRTLKRTSRLADGNTRAVSAYEADSRAYGPEKARRVWVTWYQVKWKGWQGVNSTQWVKRSSLIKTARETVEEYERSRLRS